MKKLTVFYEGPYWVGVFEQISEEAITTSRIIFGAEPKDYEIYEWILKNYYKLKFSRPIDVETKVMKKINPKRLQRKISKELNNKGVSTKAMEAIRLEREANKLEKKKKRKSLKEVEIKERYIQKQLKKKEKKKGH